MPAKVDEPGAQKLALQVVRDFYARRRVPMAGARLKVELRTRASSSDLEFDEKWLGYHNFVEFVSRCPDLTVESRPGSDFVVRPTGAPSTDGKLRVHSQLWRAFISYPIPGTKRAYDPTTGRVLYAKSEEPLQAELVPIDPIAMDEQLQWRKEFVSSLGHVAQEELSKALSAQNPFREFAVSVKRNPDWGRAWNEFVSTKAVPHIQQWAQANRIPGERIFVRRSSTELHDEIRRRQLYAFFDELAVDDLLDLQIPVRWIIASRKKGSAE